MVTSQMVEQTDLERWRIPAERVEILDIIGSGHFAVVNRAKWNGTPVAVKRAHSMRNMDLFRSEFELMKDLHHPHIVQLIGFTTETNSVSILMEYFEMGSVEDYLKANGKNVPLDLRHTWCIQMAQSLAYLHNMEPEFVIHRDVKPANFMLTSSLQIKLGDFGVSRLFSNLGDGTSSGRSSFDTLSFDEKTIVSENVRRRFSLNQLETNARRLEEDAKKTLEADDDDLSESDEDSLEQTGNVGTARYMAPEVRRFTRQTAALRGTDVKSRYGPPADIFSVGMTFYFVLEGKPPSLAGATDKYAHFKLLDQGCRPQFKRSSPAHRRIVNVCWNERAIDRPTALELITLLHGAHVAPAAMTRLLGGSGIKARQEEVQAADAVFEDLKLRADMDMSRSSARSISSRGSRRQTTGSSIESL